MAEEVPLVPIAYVNGKRYVLPGDASHVTLLSWLRHEGLTGTKLGCGEGGCGACTVMVSSYDPVADRVVHRSANACLLPLYAVESCQVVTVEGIGTEKRMHPIQEKLALAHGSQCGFCTPGFVMSMYSLYRSRVQDGLGAPTMEEIEDNLAGNLCRCTGYRPILDAFRNFSKGNDESFYTTRGSATEEANGGCCGGGGSGGGCPCKDGEAAEAKSNGAHPPAPRGEPIFPFELKKRVKSSAENPAMVVLKGPKAAWYRPGTLQELLDLKKEFGSKAKMVCGNTEVGIEVKFKHCDYPVLISPMWVRDLVSIRLNADEGAVTFGACATLTSVCEFLNATMSTSLASDEAAAAMNGHAKGLTKAYETSGCLAIVNQLKWFAGHQIKNMATIAGNVVTGSPISDLNPLWMCCGATFTVVWGDSAN